MSCEGTGFLGLASLCMDLMRGVTLLLLFFNFIFTRHRTALFWQGKCGKVLDVLN